jgi:hypothetical protein
MTHGATSKPGQSLRRAQDLGFDFPDLLAALQKVKQQANADSV